MEEARDVAGKGHGPHGEVVPGDVEQDLRARPVLVDGDGVAAGDEGVVVAVDEQARHRAIFRRPLRVHLGVCHNNIWSE